MGEKGGGHPGGGKGSWIAGCSVPSAKVCPLALLGCVLTSSASLAFFAPGLWALSASLVSASLPRFAHRRGLGFASSLCLLLT